MKKFFNEFKEFAVKGNMIDLAIGVIIGAAFKAIVDSLVADIFMPLLGILMGGIDFSGLILTVGEAEIKYGMLIQNGINFIIVALALFTFVKAINAFKKKEEKAEEEEPQPEPKAEDIVLLEEIRDALKEINNK